MAFEEKLITLPEGIFVWDGCNCKAKCDTKYCGCNKNGAKCSNHCWCDACTNSK